MKLYLEHISISNINKYLLSHHHKCYNLQLLMLNYDFERFINQLKAFQAVRLFNNLKAANVHKYNAKHV